MKFPVRHSHQQLAFPFALSIAVIVTVNPLLATFAPVAVIECELGNQKCPMACGCQDADAPQKCFRCCAIPLPEKSAPPLPNESQRVWLDWQFVSAPSPFFQAIRGAETTLGAKLTRQSSIEIVTSSSPMCGASLLLQKVSWLI